MAEETKEVHDLGIEIALVIGGGNLAWGACGKQEKWIVCRLTILECLGPL